MAAAGPMTIVCLLYNTVRAPYRRAKLSGEYRLRTRKLSIDVERHDQYLAKCRETKDDQKLRGMVQKSYVQALRHEIPNFKKADVVFFGICRKNVDNKSIGENTLQ